MHAERDLVPPYTLCFLRRERIDAILAWKGSILQGIGMKYWNSDRRLPSSASYSVALKRMIDTGNEVWPYESMKSS